MLKYKFAIFSNKYKKLQHKITSITTPGDTFNNNTRNESTEGIKKAYYLELNQLCIRVINQ